MLPHVALERHFQHLHDNPPPGFNPHFRPGFAKAVNDAYAAYCESAEAPQTKGPSPVRAARYAQICKELARKFPSRAELAAN